MAHCDLGGICFQLRDTPSAKSQPNTIIDTPPTSYIMLKVRFTIRDTEHSRLRLQSVPLSLRAMFDQYFQLAHRIRKHYLSPSVILLLLTGQFLPPIHRKSLYSLQYSMLPIQRASVREIWTRLTEKGPKTANGYAKVPNGTLAMRRKKGP